MNAPAPFAPSGPIPIGEATECEFVETTFAELDDEPTAPIDALLPQIRRVELRSLHDLQALLACAVSRIYEFRNRRNVSALLDRVADMEHELEKLL